MAARFEAFIDRRFNVSEIVERVEDTDDVHAVLNALADETTHSVIRVVPVTQDILSAQKHLELGVLEVRLDLAQTLSWVFVQVTQVAVKGRTAPAFDGVVARFVHLVEYALEIAVRHTGRYQRLLRVTENCLGDALFLEIYSPFCQKIWHFWYLYDFSYQRLKIRNSASVLWDILQELTDWLSIGFQKFWRYSQINPFFLCT